MTQLNYDWDKIIWKSPKWSEKRHKIENILSLLHQNSIKHPHEIIYLYSETYNFFKKEVKEYKNVDIDIELQKIQIYELLIQFRNKCSDEDRKKYGI